MSLNSSNQIRDCALVALEVGQLWLNPTENLPRHPKGARNRMEHRRRSPGLASSKRRWRHIATSLGRYRAVLLSWLVAGCKAKGREGPAHTPSRAVSAPKGRIGEGVKTNRIGLPGFAPAPEQTSSRGSIRGATTRAARTSKLSGEAPRCCMSTKRRWVVGYRPHSQGAEEARL